MVPPLTEWKIQDGVPVEKKFGWQKDCYHIRVG